MSDLHAEPTAAGTGGTRGAPRLVGILAAGLALASAEFVAGALPGARSPFEAVADGFIALAPAWLVAAAIDVLGPANRLVLLAAMLGVAAAAGALVGAWTTRWRWAALVGLTPFALIGAAAGIADPLLPNLTAVAASLLGVVAGAAVLWWLPGAVMDAAATAGHEATTERALPDPAGPPTASRREVLGWGATAAAAAVLTVTGRVLQARALPDVLRDRIALPRPPNPLPAPPAGAAVAVEGVSPLVTPNDEFYRIDTAFVPPRIDADRHEILVTGLVDRPLRVPYDELLAMADTEADVTLACVSNEVGGRLIGNARWLGVPLERLLERAGVRPEATQVVGRAVDGWTAGFPVAVLDGRPALVAVGMNGEPLPTKHGFPVRLVIAGLYGYVSDTKWLAELELTTFEDYDAYWVRRGWAREGPIKTQSRIDVPGHGRTVPAGVVTVAGVAWAGARGVARVEVAVDETPWAEADLAAELASTTWRLWRLDWDAAPGEHVLRVRATDGAGETQTEQVAPPAPDGATGHHTIRVTVA